jgi:hypothetical protein
VSSSVLEGWCFGPLLVLAAFALSRWLGWRLARRGVEQPDCMGPSVDAIVRERFGKAPVGRGPQAGVQPDRRGVQDAPA